MMPASRAIKGDIDSTARAQKALLRAVGKGSRSGVERALRQGALPWPAHGESDSPLACAAYLHHGSCLAAMLPLVGADRVGELIMALRSSMASRHWRGIEQAQALHARLQALELQHPGLLCPASKASLCADAASAGDARSMREWILLGAATAEPGNPDSAFIRASQRGHAECLRILIPLGVDSLPNEHGNNALDMCFAQGHEEASRLLLAAGLRPNPEPADGWTMLMRAAKFSPAMVEMALPFCDPNALNRFGLSALMIAARMDRFACVERLLPACDPSLRAPNGRQALDHARDPEVRELIGRWIARERALQERDMLERACPDGAEREGAKSL